MRAPLLRHLLCPACAITLTLQAACASQRAPETAPVASAAAARERLSPPERPYPTPLPLARPDVIASGPAESDTAVIAREYRGSYSSGYEISWFTPCDAQRGDDLWWVTLTETARLQRDSLVRLFATKPTQGLAVRWRGTVSPRMSGGAGHMGRGSRYMLVSEIVSVRALNPEGACGPPGRSS